MFRVGALYEHKQWRGKVVRSITDDGQIGERVTITREALPLVIEALQRRLADHEST